MKRNWLQILVYVFICILFVWNTSCNSKQGSTTQNESKATVKLEDAEMKALTEMFNYFVKTDLQPITKDGENDDQLFTFGVHYFYVFEKGKFEKANMEEGLNMKIKISLVNELIAKYFGKEIKEPLNMDGHITYKDGYFYTRESDSPEASAKIEELSDNGDGLYTAIVGIYSPVTGEIDKTSNFMKATIKKVDGRFILIDWQKKQ